METKKETWSNIDNASPVFTPEVLESGIDLMVSQAKAKRYFCDICQDTGTIDVLEQVEPGEPHLALIGVRKCICAEDHEDRDDDY